MAIMLNARRAHDDPQLRSDGTAWPEPWPVLELTLEDLDELENYIRKDDDYINNELATRDRSTGDLDFVEKARNIIKNEGGRVYYSSWWWISYFFLEEGRVTFNVTRTKDIHNRIEQSAHSKW